MLTIDFIGYFAKCLPKNGQENLTVLTEDCRGFEYQNGGWVEINLPCEFIFLNQSNCQAYWVKKCCEKTRIHCGTLIDQNGGMWIYEKCIGCWIQQTPSTGNVIGSFIFTSGLNLTNYAVITDNSLYIGQGNYSQTDPLDVAFLASAVGLENETGISFNAVASAYFESFPFLGLTNPLTYVLWLLRYDPTTLSYPPPDKAIKLATVGIDTIEKIKTPYTSPVDMKTDGRPIRKNDYLWVTVDKTPTKAPGAKGVFGFTITIMSS